MTHSSYPIALDLFDKPCLVVGSGELAHEKTEGLLRVSARVTVVGGEPISSLRVLADAGVIDLRSRDYEVADLAGITLAYGASEDRELNARVAHDARAAGVLVNAVDDIPNCDFFAVSLVRRGDLQIAISTNGRSPAMARWVREYLDSWVPMELGGLLDVLADVRTEVRANGNAPAYDRWNAAISEEVLLRLRHGDEAGARSQVYETLTGTRSAGAEGFVLGPAETLW
jgi:precorrin-2 dehydrogenase / sirohydrochlorin ferrochelatase